MDSSWIYRSSKGAYSVEEDELIESEENVIYIGFFNAVWGHLITDCLKFLWFLKSEPYNQFGNYQLVYNSVTDELPYNFKKLLELLNIDYSRFVRIETATRFKEVIIPDECFYLEGTELEGSYKYTQEYVELINRIMHQVQPYDGSKYDKIYLTRSRFNAVDLGEWKIEQYFKNKGYTVVAPETFSLEEQLRIFKSCNHFAGTDGSISHNAVFMKNDIDAIIILRGAYITRYQFAISELRNMKVDYIEAHLSLLQSRRTPQFGPNFYYVSEYLLKYFGEELAQNTKKYWFDNFGDFENYLCSSVEYDLTDRVSDICYYKEAVRLYKEYRHYREKYIVSYCINNLMTRCKNKADSVIVKLRTR